LGSGSRRRRCNQRGEGGSDYLKGRVARSSRRRWSGRIRVGRLSKGDPRPDRQTGNYRSRGDPHAVVFFFVLSSFRSRILGQIVSSRYNDRRSVHNDDG
jgi:hypothetical protein